MTVKEFAHWHSISESLARECIRADTPIHGKTRTYPPLRAKRLKNGRLYVTAEQAAEWRENLPDA